MRFWRKKNDGFEWRSYVKTTILMRREQRRAQVRGAVAGAAEGIKAAGQAAAVRADKGVRASAGVAASWLAGATAVSRTALGGLGRLARRTLEAGAVSLRPVLDVSGRPAVSSKLAAVALIAVLIAAARIVQLGPDLWAALTLLAAVVLLFFAWAPRLAVGDRPWLLAPILALPSRAQMAVFAVLGATALSVFAWPMMGGHGAMIALPRLPLIGAPPIEGKAQILSGGLLRIEGQLVRLAGVEVPEREQRCPLSGSRTWNCGRAADGELARLVKGKPVTCQVRGRDEAGVTLAGCDAGGIDLAGALVKAGYAFASEGIFAPYTGDEADARARKVGLWRGNPERPTVAKAKAWEAAKVKAPDGCPIKGHVVSGTKVYVLPWDPDYSRRSVQKSRGDRWFCSEAEAQSAGWKLSQRS